MVNNKYINVVKKAYELGEMGELYGCKESYSLDENGKYYLNQDVRLTGVAPEDADPINMEAIISATEMFYCSLDRKSGQKKRFLTEFSNTLVSLIESKEVADLYFAVEIYFILGNRENKDVFYPLKGVYKQLKKKIEQNTVQRCGELKSEKKYAGSNQVDGMWSVILNANAMAANEVKIMGVE